MKQFLWFFSCLQYIALDQNFYTNSKNKDQKVLICQNEKYLLQEQISEISQEKKLYHLIIVENQFLINKVIVIKANSVFCQKDFLMFVKQFNEQYQELVIFYFEKSRFQMKSLYLKQKFCQNNIYKMFIKNENEFILVHQYLKIDQNLQEKIYVYKIYILEGFQYQYIHQRLLNKFEDKIDYYTQQYIQQDFQQYLIFANHEKLLIFKNYFDENVFNFQQKITKKFQQNFKFNFVSIQNNLAIITDSKKTFVYLIQIQNGLKDQFNVDLIQFQKFNYGFKKQQMNDLSDVVYYLNDFIVIKFKTFFQTDIFFGECYQKKIDNKTIKYFKKFKMLKIDLKKILQDDEKQDLLFITFTQKKQKIVKYHLNDIQNSDFKQQFIKAEYIKKQDYLIDPININFIFKSYDTYSLKYQNICPQNYQLIQNEQQFCIFKKTDKTSQSDLQEICKNNDSFYCLRFKQNQNYKSKVKYFHIQYSNIQQQQLEEYCQQYNRCYECVSKYSCDFAEDKCKYKQPDQQTYNNYLSNFSSNLSRSNLKLLDKLKRCLIVNQNDKNCIAKINQKENNAIVKLVEQEKYPNKFDQYTLCTFTLNFNEEQLTSVYLQNNFRYKPNQDQQEYNQENQIFIEKFSTDLDGKTKQNILSFTFDQFYEYIKQDEFSLYGYELRFYLFFIKEVVYEQKLILKFLDTTPNITFYLLLFFFCMIIIIVLLTLICYAIGYTYQVLIMVNQKEKILNRISDLLTRKKSYKFELLRKQRTRQVQFLHS